MTSENKNQEQINHIPNTKQQSLPTTNDKITKPTPKYPHETQKPTWTTFTYYGLEIRTIIKLFKTTNTGMASRTTYTIRTHLK